MLAQPTVSFFLRAFFGAELGSPCANEHPPIELRRDRCLVLLDVHCDLVRLLLPALLGDRLDALELDRVRVDPFLQTLDLVDGKPLVPDEQVAHGDIQITLALAVRGVSKVSNNIQLKEARKEGRRTFNPSNVFCKSTLV